MMLCLCEFPKHSMLIFLQKCQHLKFWIPRWFCLLNLVNQPVLPSFGAGVPTPVPTGPPVPPVVPAPHVPMMQQPVAGTGTQMLVPVFPAAQMRPKEPPTFRGDLNEDIDAWYSLVQDYCHLMGTSEAQNVAYMATLLQGAARVFWDSVLRASGGR